MTERFQRLAKAFVDRCARVLLGRVSYARWKGVKVGEGCRILSCNFGSEPFLIELGDRVGIATGVAFLTHDGATWLLRDGRGRKHHYAPVRVGNDVFIGYGAIILPGVEIGDRVIVGAGSVVTRSVESGSVVAGNPARFICSFDDYARRRFVSECDKSGRDHRERVMSVTSLRHRDTREPLRRCSRSGSRGA